MLIEAAKGGHTNVVTLLIDYPNSLMIPPADGDGMSAADALRLLPQGMNPDGMVTPPLIDANINLSEIGMPSFQCLERYQYVLTLLT